MSSSLPAMFLIACLSLLSVSRLEAAAVVKDCILMNHVGFVPWSAKFCVVLNPPAKEFSVRKAWNGQIIYRGRLKHVNTELGDGWSGDFSSLREEGTYRIECGALRSRIVVISRDALDQPLRVLFNYFPTQRCGDSPTGWHAPCHTDDARRVDTGEHVALAGGWHQSCDLRKWMFGTPFGLVGLAEFEMLKHPRWDRGQIADELRWGNRYFHNMVRPDGGLMDHVVVPVRWEKRDVYPNDPPFCAND
ncbi:MAG: glycoside hydrolase family 9 protein [Thermoguttaceae bacterium]